MDDIAKTELTPLEALKPAPRNARTHSRKQIRQIAASIERFGWTNPILADDDGVIIAGHARVEAARKLGLERVPVRRLSSMTAADKRAYIIADNRLALSGGWDFEILAGEMKQLIAEGYDFEVIGWEHVELDRILIEAEEADPNKRDPEDEKPVERPAQPVTQQGYIWLLGKHRLICGDAKDPAVVEAVMRGDPARMAFLDPPYNVPIDGHVSGLGETKHREFPEGCGELSFDGFVEFLQAAFENVERSCVNGAIVYACMDWRHQRELLAAGYSVFTELKNLCVWKKANAGMGTFYRSHHELIYVWKVGDAEHVNTFGLGDTGRHRTNVWSYAGVNSFRAGRAEELAMHPTVKPVAMVVDAILDVSRRGDIVLDTFGGSGTTLIAAQRTGRLARLVEIDPQYCDVTVLRWQQMTGQRATLESTGMTFEQAGETAAWPTAGKEGLS